MMRGSMKLIVMAGLFTVVVLTPNVARGQQTTAEQVQGIVNGWASGSVDSGQQQLEDLLDSESTSADAEAALQAALAEKWADNSIEVRDNVSAGLGKTIEEINTVDDARADAALQAILTKLTGAADGEVRLRATTALAHLQPDATIKDSTKKCITRTRFQVEFTINDPDPDNVVNEVKVYIDGVLKATFGEQRAPFRDNTTYEELPEAHSRVVKITVRDNAGDKIQEFDPEVFCVFGACCGPDNSCTQLTEVECKELGKGYTYRGDGTPCGDDGTCIPTVSEWGLVVMALLVLAAATVVIMRRRAIVQGRA